MLSSGGTDKMSVKMKKTRQVNLNRLQLMLAGWCILILCFFATQFTKIFLFNKTTGKVVGYETVLRGRGVRGSSTTSDVYAIIQLQVEGKKYQFQAVENLGLQRDEVVPVIYDPGNPNDAYLYSFIGFWYMKILVFVFIGGIWGVFSYSYLEKKETLIIDLENFRFGKSPYRKDPHDNGFSIMSGTGG